MSDVASDLAWLRTRLAIERSLMAWVRTAVSLIGFGFTIEQFFQHLAQESRAVAPRAPQILGLTLIGVGVAALAVTLLQYRRLDRFMWSGPYLPLASVNRAWPRSTPLVGICAVMMVVGVFAFAAVLIRL